MHTLELPYQVEAFFELTPDFVCIAGKDGYFKNINHAVVNGLGYTKEELMASPISAFMHPDDVQHTIERRNDLFKGNALLNFENRYITKQGEVVWLQWTSTYFSEWEIVFAIAKNITPRKIAEQKAAEEFVAVKSLTQHFKNRIEEDKKFVATELHEELAQLASVVKMNMDWVKMNETELSETAKARLEHSSLITDLLINSIRRLSFKLSPPMLDEMGLAASIEWQCNEFATFTGIPCKYNNINLDEAKISVEEKIDFFRISQEALNYLLNRKTASEISISIEQADHQIQLQITDAGRGFDQLHVQHVKEFSSLLNRIASVKGKIQMSETEHGSTSISVTLFRQ